MKSLTQQAQAAMDKAMDLHPRVGYAGEAANGAIKVWLVAGRSGDYAVYEEDAVMHCTCEAGQRGIICYHRASVALANIERDAADAFNAALDQSIKERQQLDEEEDAALACAVGAWYLDHKSDLVKPANQSRAKDVAIDGFDLRNVLSFMDVA